MSSLAPRSLRAGVLLLATALAAAIGPAPLTAGPAASAAAATTYDLRVGSFNVRSITKDYLGEGRPWRDRRAPVVRDILGEGVDVVGVQEASQNVIYADQLVDPQARNQMEDLVAGLNAGGAAYALTNTAVADCVKEYTNYKCSPLDRDASRDTRIVYNTRTLALLDSDSYRYSVQSGFPNDDRYLVWATFQVIATGQQFFFATTHLTNKDGAKQKAQVQELIAEVGRRHGSLPVVVTGDFQRSKWNTPIDWTLKAMRQAGYGDVVNQTFGTAWVTRPRAQKRINGWFNSKNTFRRDITRYAYEENHTKAGNNIDWIWATNALPVKEWKVVVHYNPDTNRLTGVIPSDHMMVRATVTLL